ncbi:MAG: GxxExxY protein [Planctomycetota bacterium]|nr:MAG: GxxExxY protein [Planctomycetota bacterium]REJ95488.1 MAG: GxxExxY protein [Planctomycetota bacterium]REK26569.1 MAG: GxxExxY protein [Planctomycetota bacterium]REK34005.1 MAG: GxxExxY protein [Planctomycetota bacterium]
MKPEFEPIPAATEELAKAAIDAAITVHRALGPGLLEGVYEACFCHELSRRNIPFQRQLNLPVVYDSIRLDAGLRIDVLVDECVVVELKAVEKLIPLYEAQLLTYLKLTGHRLGLLINFNVPLLKDGLKRLVC